MTPAERLLKAVHMEIEDATPWLNALRPQAAHEYVIRVRPTDDAYLVSISVDKAQRRV